MKKNYTKWILLTMVILSFGFNKNTIAQNLLVNGDMETVVADTLAGWDIKKDGISVAVESSIVHGGTHSAAVTVTGNKANTDFGEHFVFIADSSVTYDFSVWSYNTEGNVYFAWVVGFGPGAYTFSSSAALHTDNTIVNEWQQFNWQWTSFVTDTVDVFFRFYDQENFDGSEVIYIDDASVMVNVPSTDATLSDLTIEGGTVADFSPDVYHYDVYLPQGTTDVPAVDAVLNDTSATVDITQATDLNGDESARTATVLVTAEDGTTTQSYTITFTVVTGINTPAAERINLYPNPARDQIVIRGLSNGKISDINLMDVTGRIIKTFKSTGIETTLNIDDLHAGCYFVRVENRTLKFIKR